MSETTPNAWSFYQGWNISQEALIKAITPLSAEQLTLHAAANLRSIEGNCLHIIGARARWCHIIMGLGDAHFAAFGKWDRSDMPARSADELVEGLRQSWQVLHEALIQWTPADLAYTYPNDEPEPGEPAVFTRQWIIWHLIEHDLFHSGEISQILGMHGLPGMEL